MTRAWSLVKVLKSVRIMSNCDPVPTVIVQHRTGADRVLYYHPSRVDGWFEQWNQPPAYLLRVVQQEVARMWSAGEFHFYERTQDGYKRTDNLRYYEPDVLRAHFAAPLEQAA